MGALSIEDRLAINDVFVRYTTSLDSGEIEDVVSCFTEDCEIETPVSGRHLGHDGVRNFARNTIRFRKENGAQFRHVVTNLRIEIDGNRARARCYLLDFLTTEGKTELLSPGEYDCNFVKANGEWRMQSRLVRLDTPFSNARWAKT